MSVYKNIDGTSKKSFKLGPKGLELRTDIAVDPKTQQTIRHILRTKKPTGLFRFMRHRVYE